MTENISNLATALAKAQADAKQVEKDATNQHMRYGYASTEAMIIEAKETMAKHGLSLVPTTLNVVSGEAGQPYLFADWMVLHSSGESMRIHCEWPIMPEGKHRPLDKALASARTSSLGYLLRDLLQLPRVDETDEMDHSRRDEPQKSDRKPRQEKKADAPPPPPAAPEVDVNHLKALRGLIHDCQTAKAIHESLSAYRKAEGKTAEVAAAYIRARLAECGEGEASEQDKRRAERVRTL